MEKGTITEMGDEDGSSVSSVGTCHDHPEPGAVQHDVVLPFPQLCRHQVYAGNSGNIIS